jgi:predicted small integral membrane protein
MDLSWMAWTLPTSDLFGCLAGLLLTFTDACIKYFPETPRVGVLRIETTRGDRLFITLLGSPSSISPGWVWVGPSLWCAAWTFSDLRRGVFRWV